MKHLLTLLTIVFLVASCSIIGGPDGYFPEKKYDFLKEEIEENIVIPADLNSLDAENHYPVGDPSNLENVLEVPKPRQIFSSSGDSSVQLRRLGELMWIYIETLPSTSWPISKNYWDTSEFDVTKADPVTGEIDIDFSQSSKLQMRVEHGIKEASTEVFLYKINKISGDIESDPEFVQMEMEKMIDYYANSLSNFSGTSLAAQNLNEMKKAKIFTQDGMTVISLDLNFDRAWSSVSRALDAAEIFINDRDRSNRTIYVSFVEKDERRFRLFGDRSSSDNGFGGDSQFEITISQENNKSYVRAISKDGNIEKSELLLSKINESLS